MKSRGVNFVKEPKCDRYGKFARRKNPNLRWVTQSTTSFEPPNAHEIANGGNWYCDEPQSDEEQGEGEVN